MSYQMSRVRGSEAYRLLVTRATNLETICNWIGVDKQTLLAANPDLHTEELEEGQELTVWASHVHLQLGPQSIHDDSEDETSDYSEGDTGDEESESNAWANSDEESESNVWVDSGDESESYVWVDSSDKPESELVVSEEVSGDESEPDVEAGTENQDVEDKAAEVAQTADSPVKEERKVSSPASEATAQSVTWRPFPKSVL